MWDVSCSKCSGRLTWSGVRWSCQSCHYGATAPLEAADLARIAKSAIGSGAEAAVALLKDQPLLAEVARTGSSADACRAAVKKLEDQDLLAEVALSPGEAHSFWDSIRPDPRYAAVQKLARQGLLAKVARKAPVWQVRAAATQQLTRQFTLWRVAWTDPDPTVRDYAKRQLRGPLALVRWVVERIRPSPEQREKRRQQREAEQQSRRLIAKCREQGGHYFTSEAMGLLHCVNCGHNVSRDKTGALRSVHWDGTPMTGERPLWNKTYLTDRG